MLESASASIPMTIAKRRRPWISNDTLRLIDARDEARLNRDYAAEVLKNKQIRISASNDRSTWLTTLVNDGSWKQLKALRAKPSRCVGRLRDSCGNIAASHEQACTLADYFEHVQWSIKFCTLAPERPAVREQLQVNTDRIQSAELIDAARHLKNNQSCSEDQIPADFQKAIHER